MNKIDQFFLDNEQKLQKSHIIGVNWKSAKSTEQWCFTRPAKNYTEPAAKRENKFDGVSWLECKICITIFLFFFSHLNGAPANVPFVPSLYGFALFEIGAPERIRQIRQTSNKVVNFEWAKDWYLVFLRFTRNSI